ncbi:hypothetical protein, unlikely [Trypanosoma brucei gambiense DAL972]|uniref:Uncharacterized protein n=1 Tax=Trypanosoma brucei gambiense (strain MHOM/CI/86/DAL972) TaxID=679716 RepID=D0A8L2_TRYB9|nr:hypothetical protein, unlikely [Trypanosoma brucei gambiense DAL972]CBH18013.1 hypothetical protein, unlikely [Trypanosoma brucei gambiense DAL972]|eukprot:XP_011780277.1 hypothetical protein, unlikely [Trypanosoma brucei gambiense DAL972]
MPCFAYKVQHRRQLTQYPLRLQKPTLLKGQTTRQPPLTPAKLRYARRQRHFLSSAHEGLRRSISPNSKCRSSLLLVRVEITSHGGREPVQSRRNITLKMSVNVSHDATSNKVLAGA